MVEILKVNRTIFAKALDDLSLNLSEVPVEIRSRIHVTNGSRSSAYDSKTFCLPTYKNKVSVMYYTKLTLEEVIEALEALGLSSKVRELEGDYLVAIKEFGDVYSPINVYPYSCDRISHTKLGERLKEGNVTIINF